jgi:hypothetical protein
MNSSALVFAQITNRRLTAVPDDLADTCRFEQLIQGRDRRIQALSRQVDGTRDSASLQWYVNDILNIVIQILLHGHFFADRRE